MSIVMRRSLRRNRTDARRFCTSYFLYGLLVSRIPYLKTKLRNLVSQTVALREIFRFSRLRPLLEKLLHLRRNFFFLLRIETSERMTDHRDRHHEVGLGIHAERAGVALPGHHVEYRAECAGRIEVAVH